MSQLNLLEAAKSIRPFLPELLEEQASDIDRQLADLIIRCQAGEPLENQIISLLASHDSTRQWTREFLGSGIVVPRSLGSEPLPGIPIIDAPRYVCPEGDYVWHHIDSSDPIPYCPTHNLLLKRSEV